MISTVILPFTAEGMKQRESKPLVQALNLGHLNHFTVILSNFIKPRDECLGETEARTEMIQSKYNR